MNLKEIYFLNLALDSKQIFALPEFINIGMTNLITHAVIEKLVAQEILIDKDNFSKKGIKIVKRIYDFKKSKKYIKVGNLVFGLREDNSAVLLKHNLIVNDYSFERIDMKNCIPQFIDEYPFLNSSTLIIAKEKTEHITYEKVKNKYKLDIDNCLYISSYIVDGTIITDEMVFYYDERLYLYNRRKEILEEKDGMQIRKLIVERMVV